MSGKVIKVGIAEERSETPQVTGKRKIVRVGTAGERTEN